MLGVVPDNDAFMRILVAKWSSFVCHSAVRLYLEGIQGWIRDRNTLVPPSSDVAASKRLVDKSCTSDPYMFRRLTRCTADRKRELAAQQGHEIDSVHGLGVYTDGSYAEEAS